jgi:hypothetical protein
MPARTSEQGAQGLAGAVQRRGRLSSIVPVCFLVDQVSEPRAAGANEVPPAIAYGHGDEQIGQGDVGPELLHLPVSAVAL